MADPLDLTIEEKVFRVARRICVVFAAGAVTLSALDLMNVRTVEHVAVFVHANRDSIADLPQQIRAGISSIAEAAPSPMVAVRIPRDDGDIAVAPTPAALRAETRVTAAAAGPAVTPAKAANDAIIELAAARYGNAVEEAMVAPPMVPQLKNITAAAPASPQDQPVSQPGTPVQLASLGPTILPPVTRSRRPSNCRRRLPCCRRRRRACRRRHRRSGSILRARSANEPNAASPTRSISRRAASRFAVRSRSPRWC